MRLRNFERLRVDSASICLMANILQDEGIDPEPALHRCALDTEMINGADSTVTGWQEIEFQKEFVAATRGRHDLWAKLSLRYRAPSLNPWGFAIMTSPTIGMLFKLVVEFSEISYSLVDSRNVKLNQTTNALIFECKDVPEELVEFTLFRDVIGLTNFLHDNIWNGAFPFLRVETTMPESIFAGVDLRAPIRFEAHRTAWLWPSRIADQPLAFSDPVLHASYMRKARAQAMPKEQVHPLVERIHRILDTCQDVTRLAEFAIALGMSERALQRRLAATGMTLRDILARRKRREAERLLSCTARPISEIAYVIGYSDTATFNHSFKRWTGMNPSQFRRRSWMRAEDAALR